MTAPRRRAAAPRRRAGSRWRLLVHNMADDGHNGVAQHIQSHPDRHAYRHADSDSDPDDPEMRKRIAEMRKRMAEIGAQHSVTHIIPGTEFDEMVVGRWLHVEQMDTGRWWMNVGGVTLLIDADRDGNPTRVTVYGPGDYDAPVEGCAYDCTWSHPDRGPGPTPTAAPLPTPEPAEEIQP